MASRGVILDRLPRGRRIVHRLLAGAGILAISTFNTDYILVKHAGLANAISALRTAGHVVHET